MHGKTVIVSSHLLSEIEQVANRMIIIHKGRKITEGVVSELLDPAHTIVAIETTDNAAALQQIEASPWREKLMNVQGAPQLELTRDAIPEFVQWLTAHAAVISVTSKNSLEAYFLSLTNPCLLYTSRCV